MHTNPLEMPAETGGKPSKKNPFPSARYFQVHFEYLQEMMIDLKKQLDTSNQKITLLQQQLSATIPSITEENEHNKQN